MVTESAVWDFDILACRLRDDKKQEAQHSLKITAGKDKP